MSSKEPAAPNPQMSNPTASQSTQADAEFVVQFWGVRGKIAAAGKETLRYGGNTPCVEMRVGSKRLIFDGGTGLRLLGNQLLRQMPVEAYIFFTDSQSDRIQGVPFFVPGFIKGNCFHIYGAAGSDGASIKQSLSDQMTPPNFPVPIQVMQSELQFYDLTPGETVALDDITIETCLTNNTLRTVGYRVTWKGYTAVYATGADNNPDALDENLLHLARKADLLICNATSPALDEVLGMDGKSFNPADFAVKLCENPFWQTCVKAADTANVEKLAIFSYEPDYDDDFLDQVEAQIQSVFPNGLLAREGMILPVR
ncbi:MBL fold metallo-hydrolase [Coleofasciculus sp. FACHB-1120]|uniref:MBL fold metallo-hydrolase n=1 Tax=Coleofasciculus sp. FACHB-1120 TaxID=2692783 RepID=UPI001687A355|nr:MBL fold metallo-hydrolase [Coleofasciculus sp. FACHB-1120]MBD2741632.1 MBL fold metallo-hydrolase [Coleofasciculus sp. FACHB-1120]